MTGVFTLSLDFELAWGEFYRRSVDIERMVAAREALPRLLELLERHRIPATFAVVGHLALEGCDGHPELPRPSISWRPGDWYAGDPCSDEATAPAWYAPTSIRQIAAASPGHDIGAHGFSHVPLDDPGVDARVASAELAASSAAIRAVSDRDVRSFVFPRNGIMFTELLTEFGFGCYRAAERRWYAAAAPPVRKIAHMLDQALAFTPSVGVPALNGGLAELPSSMLFLSREGFRRVLPMRSRVTRARRGLERAVAAREVFHLWLHVEDLVPDTEQMLAGLDAVLGDARARIDRERLVVHTMSSLADSQAAEPQAHERSR